MEAMKMMTKLFVALVMAFFLMAMSAVQNVGAAETPAPSPVSDATAFLPTALLSLAALAFGLVF